MTDISAILSEIGRFNKKQATGAAILVARYHRVSSDGQTKEDTISNQKQKTQEYFDKEFGNRSDVLYVGEFNDDPYTLEYFDKFKQFWIMLEKVARKEINYIIVANENRIFRSGSSELRGKITDIFVANKVTTAVPGARPKPWLKKDGLVNAVLQGVGDHEKQTMKNNVIHGQARAIERKGEFPRATFGYRITKELGRINSLKDDNRSISKVIYKEDIHENESAVIQDMFRYFTGEPLSSLSVLKVPESLSEPRSLWNIKKILEFNDTLSGIPLRREYAKYVQDLWGIGIDDPEAEFVNSTGKKIIAESWYHTTVEYILKNRVYAGERYVIFDVEGEFISSEKFVDTNIRRKYSRHRPKDQDGNFMSGHMTYEDMPVKPILTKTIPIIEMELFEKAQRKFKALASERSAVHRRGRGLGWIKSFAVCGICKGPILFNWKKDEEQDSKIYARCEYGHFSGLLWYNIEQTVFESVIDFFNKENLQQRKLEIEKQLIVAPTDLGTKKKKDLTESIAKLRNKREQIEEAFNLDQISLDRYSSLMETNESLTKKITNELHHLEMSGYEKNRNAIALEVENKKIADALQQELNLKEQIKLLGQLTRKEKLSILETVREFFRRVEIHPTTPDAIKIKKMYDKGQHTEIQELLDTSDISFKELTEILNITRYHLIRQFHVSNPGGRPHKKKPKIKVLFTFDFDDLDEASAVKIDSRISKNRLNLV